MSSMLTDVEHTRARKLAYLKSLERGGGAEPLYDQVSAIADFEQAAGEVIAKRKRDASITAITMADLRANYCETARRSDLLNMLEAEVNAWKVSNPGVRCWVFGSFLSRKPEPGDIDTLVSGPFKLPPSLPRLHPGDIQVLYQLAIPQMSKDQMVSHFNNHENNCGNEIRIDADEVVEILP